MYSSNCQLGRPFALQGDFYANIFVHFKPIFDDDAGEDTSEGEENEEIWEEEVELEERDEF